jgi:hypothetical protein
MSRWLPIESYSNMIIRNMIRQDSRVVMNREIGFSLAGRRDIIMRQEGDPLCLKKLGTHTWAIKCNGWLDGSPDNPEGHWYTYVCYLIQDQAEVTPFHLLPTYRQDCFQAKLFKSKIRIVLIPWCCCIESVKEFVKSSNRKWCYQPTNARTFCLPLPNGAVNARLSNK